MDTELKKLEVKFMDHWVPLQHRMKTVCRLCMGSGANFSFKIVLNSYEYFVEYEYMLRSTGNNYFKQRKYKKAIAFYTQAIKYYNDIKARANRCLCYYRYGLTKMGIKDATQFFKSYKDRVLALTSKKKKVPMSEALLSQKVSFRQGRCFYKLANVYLRVAVPNYNKYDDDNMEDDVDYKNLIVWIEKIGMEKNNNSEDVIMKEKDEKVEKEEEAEKEKIKGNESEVGDPNDYDVLSREEVQQFIKSFPKKHFSDQYEWKFRIKYKIALFLYKKAISSFSILPEKFLLTKNDKANEGYAELDSAINQFVLANIKPPVCPICREVCSNSKIETHIKEQTDVPEEVLETIEYGNKREEEDILYMKRNKNYLSCNKCYIDIKKSDGRFYDEIWNKIVEEKNGNEIEVFVKDNWLYKFCIYVTVRHLFSHNIAKPLNVPKSKLKALICKFRCILNYHKNESTRSTGRDILPKALPEVFMFFNKVNEKSKNVKELFKKWTVTTDDKSKNDLIVTKLGPIYIAVILSKGMMKYDHVWLKAKIDMKFSDKNRSGKNEKENNSVFKIPKNENRIVPDDIFPMVDDKMDIVEDSGTPNSTQKTPHKEE